MTSRADPRQDRKWRVLPVIVSAKVRALVSLGMVLGLATVPTTAKWTDDATATATFSTGSIDLRLGDNYVDNSPVETTQLAMTDMAPGDIIQATLPVGNAGTFPLTYSMTAGAQGGLGPSLRLSVWANGVCSGRPLLIDTAPLTTATFTDQPLGSTSAEVLCFQVSLPSNAPTSAQGLSTQAAFVFNAQGG